MKDKIRNRIYHRISEDLYNGTKGSVKVEPIQGLFNYKCFHNAVQYATDNTTEASKVEVQMGIYLDGTRAILHFWNTSGEKHLETTLGYLSTDLTYYPLRVIPVDGYPGIITVFNDAIDYFTEKYSTKLERFILGDERVI